MPLPFGLELHWPHDATEWSAWAALALVLVTATYVLETRRTTRQLRAGTAETISELRRGTAEALAELRDARFAEFLPMPRWQSPAADVDAHDGGNKTWDYKLDVLLTNEGPGPARIYKRSISVDTREPFDVRDVDEPSTLPPGGRITFKVRSEGRGAFEARKRVFTIRVSYGDLLGEFEYETVAVIEAYFDDQGHHFAGFVDSDERSALERRRGRRGAVQR